VEGLLGDVPARDVDVVEGDVDAAARELGATAGVKPA
jgi:hypothetical protein